MSGHALQKDLPRDRRVVLSDEAAWEATIDWPRAAGFDPRHDGFDFGELTRSFLWDKVGRAFRARADPERSARELALLRPSSPAAGNRRMPQPLAGFANAAAVAVRRLPLLIRRSLTRTAAVYTPVASPLLRESVVALQRHGLRIIAPHTTDAAYRGSARAPRPPFRYRADPSFAAELAGAVVRGVRSHGVELLEQDIAVLRRQTLEQTARIHSLAARIDAVRPDAILLFADNHPPFQEYAFLARRRGIPVVMLQHGLDCERLYLDRLYAPFAALWGTARRDRYAPFAGSAELHVTGNPEYDDRRPPAALVPAGESWLWATRPHAPERCYSPSRWPDEGLAILDALLATLALHPRAFLVIRPHPADLTEPYLNRIRERRMGGRVSISDAPLRTLAAKASLLFSEDSTAALEMAFEGRMLIHTHFAASDPVLPLAAHGAARLARNGEELASAVEACMAATAAERTAMCEGQRAFIAAQAGPCDGRGATRVAELMADVIRRVRG